MEEGERERFRKGEQRLFLLHLGVPTLPQAPGSAKSIAKALVFEMGDTTTESLDAFIRDEAGLVVGFPDPAFSEKAVEHSCEN